MDRVKPDTLIVMPAWAYREDVDAAAARARRKYPNVMVAKIGSNMSGYRFEKIFIFTEEPLEDFESHTHYTYIHEYLDTKLRPGGKRIELVTDSRKPGKWRFYRWSLR